jgi:Tfp pilus assembly protein PilO
VKRQVPVWPIAAIALVVLAAVAYFVLIGPKRAEAGRLSDRIASLETEVQAARLAAKPGAGADKIKIADIFELTKAMPDRPDMPGIILELNSIAESVGINFVSIAPQAAAAGGGYRIVPINLVFEGNYFDLTDFLFRIRNLVAVRDGKLFASGRFFTLDSLVMSEGPANFPQIKAELVVSAYVYDPSSVSSTPPPVVTATTTAGTTTGTTTTTAAPGASAAGAP